MLTTSPGYPQHLYRFLDGSVFTSIVWEGFLTLKRTASFYSCVFTVTAIGWTVFVAQTWKVVDTAVDRYKSRKMACRPLYELSIKAKNDPQLYKHGGDMVDIEKRSYDFSTIFKNVWGTVCAS